MYIPFLLSVRNSMFSVYFWSGESESFWERQEIALHNTDTSKDVRIYKDFEPTVAFIIQSNDWWRVTFNHYHY
jgi:hypothetical protein